MGEHIYLQAQADWRLTVAAVSEAIRRHWPGIELYPRGDEADRRLGFMAPVDGTEVDCTFFEKQWLVTADLGQPGAEVCEWFLGLVPEDVRCVVFTEQETEPVSVPARASVRQLLDAVDGDL